VDTVARGRREAKSAGPGILPAMQEPQEARPRARSPFTAAFLSLLFPGLGQWYAGATVRALAFAALPVLAIALLAGIGLRMDRIALLGLVFDPNVLTGVFVLNLLVLVYRVVAVVDAYRVAEFVNAQAASGDGRAGRARLRRNPLSLAGLLAVLLVMATSHVVVARYDTYAMELVSRGCDSIFIGADTAQDCTDDPTASASPSASEDASAEPTASPTAEPSLVGTPVPNVSIAPWDGKKRLNVLLIGADEQAGGHNTDSLIVVSIDPVTKQVAMFSLPRDTVDVPIPAGPARQVWGRTYSGKINSFFINNRKRSDLWPGNNRTRGYNALKTVLGELYDLDIKYFVEVNFAGFKKVVDAVGGVTINVQIPVSDDRYPGETGQLERLYIPTGIQHMDGTAALRYARSRHASTDFDRAQRQQRVLLSIREQADPQNLLPRLPDLIDALKQTVRTDVPLDQMDELLGLASQVDTKNIRSYVFAPPLYSYDTCADSRGCIVVPNIDRIKAAVKAAFKGNPADEVLRQTLATEGANVWVLNGTSDQNRGANLAGYLDYRGLAASAPRQKPAGAVPSDTKIVVYNGAEVDIPQTIAYLEKAFDVKVRLVNDPAIRTDVIITIGTHTPRLAAPLGA
jgi:LCP family protein required for cell wall assembly